MFGARREAREVAEVEAGVLAELVAIRAVVHPMQRRRRQLIPPALPLRLRGFQPIAQRHNSSTLATMRCCSARGGRGAGNSSDLVLSCTPETQYNCPWRWWLTQPSDEIDEHTVRQTGESQQPIPNTCPEIRHKIQSSPCREPLAAK